MTDIFEFMLAISSAPYMSVAAFILAALILVPATYWVHFQIEQRAAQLLSYKDDATVWHKLFRWLDKAAPSFVTPPGMFARRFDSLFDSGGRPFLDLSGDSFVRGCIFLNLLLAPLGGVIILLWCFVLKMSSVFLFVPLVGGLLIFSGAIAMQIVAGRTKDYSSEVVRSFPFFLDVVMLVFRSGGTAEQALEVYCRHSESPPMRREAERVLREIRERQPVAKAFGDLADRVADDKIKQTIRTISVSIASSGNPGDYSKLSEQLREMRAQNAKAIAQGLSEKINFPQFVAFAGVILYIIATILPIMGRAF